MSQSSSVAPRERINIRYKPAVGDAKEELELPHKLLMVGDYTLRPDDTPLEDRQRIDVNKNNFNDVMRAQKLHLDLSVPSHLHDESEGAANLSVSLDIATLRDMEPDSIAKAVPELKKLLELRQALSALKGPLGNMASFRKAIERILTDEGLREKLLSEISTETKAGE
ncbi:type VI secretion system contractile sheath small subunit [Acetobacter okinawensis]|uniref:Type VI secretion protein n=1 Tax=Acetobacter okinawensis TaxID=1076594 RepID=A0A252BVH8_9PROT|nr:type VI secretion system contractile sheath small subunit [Acetobacter okinawensis]OUJ12923.1 type VI secretion protein [Acetobacter okinawensis]